MRWRDVYLQKEKVLAASGTEIINIDVSNPVVALDLIFDGVFGGSGCEADKKLYQDISKIEIVDGSDVLFSMSATELLALNSYELKHFPHVVIDNEIDGVEQFKATVFFGRNYLDTEYMLDPNKFVNPQLRITYAFTEGASNWLANNQKVTVIARVCEQPVGTPKGFFMSKEAYSWTTATSGDETIDMPRDHAYRMIVARKYYSGERADEAITNLKLSCDMDKFVPFDVKGTHLGAQNQQQFGEFRMIQTQDMVDDDILFTPLSKVLYVQGISETEARLINWDAIDAEACTINLFTHAADSDNFSTSVGTAEAVTCNVIGLEPFHSLCLPFGDLWDSEEFFDPVNYGSVRLLVTQGGTAGTGEIVIQQIRNY